MLRSAYYRIYCIYFDQILYSDKDHQNSSLNGPNTRTTNPKRRTDDCHFEKMSKTIWQKAALPSLITPVGGPFPRGIWTLI